MGKKSKKKQIQEMPDGAALGWCLSILVKVYRGEWPPDKIRLALQLAPHSLKKDPDMVNLKLLHMFDLINGAAEKGDEGVQDLNHLADELRKEDPVTWQ